MTKQHDGNNLLYAVKIYQISPGRISKAPSVNGLLTTLTLTFALLMGEALCTEWKKLRLKLLEEIQLCNVLPQELVFDYIWHCLYFMDNPCPSWSGYMTDKREDPGNSSVSLFPIIDLTPTDMACIFSTLKFVKHQAKDLRSAPIDKSFWDNWSKVP